ncbi:hypothetical protein [Cohnella boryungensis]|uniref:MarR family transcriptional regulator n=1 Tax=Cohnella boryungensis TaxID=768479 RepID=A0ABV8SHY9_9BACL
MLNDTSRKVLRILYNTRHVPPIPELARRAGRTTGQVKMALRVLSVGHYIAWTPDRHEELRVLQGWEVQPVKEALVSYRWWEED